MKRLFTTLLLLLLLQPLLTPLLAATGDPDAGLPACCRRSGKHHCAMRMAMLAAAERADTTVAVRAPFHPCPMYPRALPVRQHHDASSPGHAPRFSGLVRQPSVTAEAECLSRLAMARCRGDRGPPALRS